MLKLAFGYFTFRIVCSIRIICLIYFHLIDNLNIWTIHLDKRCRFSLYRTTVMLPFVPNDLQRLEHRHDLVIAESQLVA